MSGDDNLWYVKTPDGDVHRVTLDQLDEAFQAGRIDGKVMVLAAGATTWQTLSSLAGLDEAPPSAPVAPTWAAPPIMASSLRPVSIDLSDLGDLDENTFRKKSRKGLVVGAMVGVLAVCGAVVGKSRLQSLHFFDSGTSVAAAAPPDPTPATPPPAPVPDPAPVAAANPAPSAPQLTDDQKQKLAAADKTTQDKAKSKKKGHAYSGGGGGGGGGGGTGGGGEPRAGQEPGLHDRRQQVRPAKLEPLTGRSPASTAPRRAVS